MPFSFLSFSSMDSTNDLHVSEAEARADAVWEKMNKGISNKTLQGLLKKKPSSSTAKQSSQKSTTHIKEVRGFAGQDIEVKKLVDADSKEALAKGTKASAPSAVDSVLEQIKKKQKLSVLDKTKMDWGEFKDENRGMEEELDVYKKSSNQYLDKVSFLQRTDYREFERERDSRLALQCKRKSDSHDGP